MAEMAWVRRLARALVRDDALADDVAQDTWVVAAERRPAGDRSLRPWLARVVSNLVRTRRRAELRRDARESAVEDTRRVHTPAELIERVELQRVVAEEVLALGEPYRSTVLLHFFEGLSSVELAERLGVPAGTVRRRLKVALDQLREALRARADPPDRGWLAALAPLAKVSAGRAPEISTVMGVVAVKKLLAIVALIMLAAGAGFLWRRHRAAPPRLAASVTRPSPMFSFQRPEARGVVPAWLAQADVAPRRIAGRVVAGTAPVGGAAVKLALKLGIDSLQPFAETTSAADGSFDFGMQPAAVFVVSAADPAHAAVQKTIALADPRVKSDQLVLELPECRARLSGVVRDAGGGAIANAHLATAGTSGADSDRAGRYSVCLTPEDAPGPSETEVRVDADGYGSVSERVSVVGELHHDFVLAPEAILVGRVMVGDQPVFGARVTATHDISARAHRVVGSWAESDRDGHFRIGGLAPGRFQLEAFGDHLGTSAPVPAIARSAATSHEIRLAVTAFARVRGRVVMDGSPIAGATVAVATNAPSASSTASISQADGSFVLDRVPYGTVKLVAPPYEVRGPESLAVAVAAIDGVELEVAKLKTMHGRVTCKGKPVADAGIDCSGHATRAGADGTYVLEGLTTSPVNCSAWNRSAGAFTTSPSVALSGDDTAVDFELASAGEVKGTIVDEAGSGVAGAYVQLDLVNGGDDLCEAVADGHGSFDCTMLSGGDYVATVTPSPEARQPFAPASSSGYETIHVPRDGVVTGVTLAIKNQRLAIRGTVVDDTGVAVADVSVEAVGVGRGSMFLPQTLSDMEGHFEIDDLAPGTYSLHARAAEGSETEVSGVASGSSAVTVTLARPGEIDGTLVGFSSTPVVRARTMTADLVLGTDAIVDGDTFVASGLKPGEYTVEAQAGAEVDGAEVDVRSNEVAHVTLTSRALGKVAGRLAELGTDAPVAGMRCDGNLSIGGQMTGTPPDETRQAFTDANGRFIVNAPLGRVRVFCFLPGSTALSPAGTDVDVTSGAVAGVDLVAVRPAFGATPGNAGFGLDPAALPIAVDRVDPKGPGAAGGLLVGDVIVTIDGTSLQGMLPQGAQTLVMNHHPGTTMTLGIERAGATRTLTIIVGS